MMRVASAVSDSCSRLGRLASSSGASALRPFCSVQVRSVAKKHAHQERRIEAVGLGPLVLARDGKARGVDDVYLDAARVQPASQPEAVAPSFVGERDTANVPSVPGRLVAPTMNQLQESVCVRVDFLKRPPLDTWPSPATSHPLRLNSTTTIIVLSCSNGTRDRLRSFGLLTYSSVRWGWAEMVDASKTQTLTRPRNRRRVQPVNRHAKGTPYWSAPLRVDRIKRQL